MLHVVRVAILQSWTVRPINYYNTTYHSMLNSKLLAEE